MSVDEDAAEFPTKPTGGLVQMRQVCQVFAGFKHGRVHQGREIGVIVDLQFGLRCVDCFCLFHGTWTSQFIAQLQCQVQRQVQRVNGKYLSIFKLKDELHFITIHQLLLDLRGNPSLRGIRLPGPRSNLVDMRHGSDVEGNSRKQSKGKEKRKRKMLRWLGKGRERKSKGV